MSGLLQDIPTNAGTNVTCMVTDPNLNSTIVAGCGDGSIRVYDKRMSPQSWLVKLFLKFMLATYVSSP